ncbi:hypothetical protein NX059_000186 [Plenodomus lindquistii]|nr:hypothetical protein NX059_000186 [Plenodomus lindquistii]
MGLRANSISSGTRGASPLFYSPPPSDALADSTHHGDADVEADVHAATDDDPYQTSDKSDSRAVTGICLQRLTSSQEAGQPQTGMQQGHEQRNFLKKDAVNVSLTSMDALAGKGPRKACDDSLVKEPGKGEAHLTPSNPKPHQAFPSLRQITGYATSDDDGISGVVVHPLKKQALSRQADRSKARGVSKFAEHVANDSSSASDAGAKSSQSSLTPSVPPTNMARREKVHGPAFNMDGNRKPISRTRDPHNLAAPRNNKLPKTQGGFVLSDESETEDGEAATDKQPEYLPSSTARTMHTLSPPSSRPETSVSNCVPKKRQLNKSRLSKLLSRDKPPFHQGPPKAASLPAAHAAPSSAPRPRPSSSLATNNFIERTRDHEANSSVEQRDNWKMRPTMTPSAKVMNGPAPSPVREQPGQSAPTRSLLQPPLREVQSGSLDTPKTQQTSRKGPPTKSLGSIASLASPASPSVVGSPGAKQPHRRPREPLLTTGESKPPVPVSTQGQLVRDTSRGQEDINKSASHLSASTTQSQSPQPAQKRKLEHMACDQTEDVVPSKKRSTVSSERQNAPGKRLNNIQERNVDTRVVGSLVVSTPVVGGSTATILGSTDSANAIPVTEASVRPSLLNATVMPSSPPVKKTFTVADDLNTKDVCAQQASPTNKKVVSNCKQSAAEVTSKFRENDVPSKMTSQTRVEAGPVPSVPICELVVDQDTVQLPGTPPIASTRESSGTNARPEDLAQHSVRKTQDVVVPPTTTSEAPESYFEYSIFERRWSDEQDEYEVKETEVLLRPFTGIDEANKQVEKLFQRMREEDTWHTQTTLADWNTKRDEHGCLICKASFARFDNPYKEHFVKIWVQRDYVSELANRTPQKLERTSFISGTVYVLRLFKIKILTPDDESDTEEAIDKPDSRLRLHEPLIRSEIYTTLCHANRAARDQQLEISHEKDATNLLTLKWQEQDAKKLDEKLRNLNSAKNGEEAYWESVFNAHGIGGDQFELKVEEAGICGPRNL